MGKSHKQREDDVLLQIHKLLENDWSYFETDHATDRMRELRIQRAEVLYVLCNGTRDTQHDILSKDKDLCRYAICGETLDGDRNLRVIVCIAPIPVLPEDEYIVVVTVIDLNE